MKTATTKWTRQWRSALSDYVTALAWSPQGQWLAAASGAGEISLYDCEQQAIILQSPTGQAISHLEFSADGQFLAAVGQAGTVTVWQVTVPDQTAIVWTQTHSGTWLDQLAWHPQHPQLAYGIGSQIQIWDIAAGQNITTVDFQSSSVLHLAWHPQGTALAVSGHGGIKVWSPADWTAAPSLIAVPGASLYVAWSATGRYLGSGNLDRTLTVAEWGSPPPWLMQGFPGKVRQLAWSQSATASGSPVLAAACAEGITVWEREGQSQSSWRSQVLHCHTERVNAIAFQPHRLLLASAGQDGIIGLWKNGKTLAQTLKLPESGCSALAWHPDGSGLVVAGTTGEIVLWQLVTRAKGFG